MNALLLITLLPCIPMLPKGNLGAHKAPEKERWCMMQDANKKKKSVLSLRSSLSGHVFIWLPAEVRLEWGRGEGRGPLPQSPPLFVLRGAGRGPWHPTSALPAAGRIPAFYPLHPQGPSIQLGCVHEGFVRGFNKESTYTEMLLPPRYLSTCLCADWSSEAANNNWSNADWIFLSWRTTIGLVRSEFWVSEPLFIG